MTTDPVAEFSDDLPGLLAREEEGGAKAVAGVSPGRLALRRLRRNKVALAFGVLFILLVASAVLAPLWADNVAKTTPDRNHLSDTIEVGGETINVVSFDGVGIGPQWFKADGKFFLGADRNGRDVMVRLLYGGRNSLLIGLSAAMITLTLSVLLGVIAGYFRGWADGVISRVLDVMWAFPPLLLAIALGVSLQLSTVDLVLFELKSGSLLIPIFAIGVIGVPYVARPIRGQVLSIREKEFVDAARAQGAGSWRIMFSEVLPNVASTILVFFPLLVAQAILNEAALSFLGAGVQPPDPSWGTMIAEGIEFLVTAPHLTIVPGLMLVLTVLALNVFGDGVRDALDPRAKVKITA